MTKAPHTKRLVKMKKSRSVTSDLETRIAKAQDARRQGNGTSASASTGHGAGLGRAARLGTEFIAAILVGAGIGYVGDLALGTRPWLMLVMLLVGFASGILNVVRVTAEMAAENPAPLNADLGPEDDDEEY